MAYAVVKQVYFVTWKRKFLLAGKSRILVHERNARFLILLRFFFVTKQNKRQKVTGNYQIGKAVGKVHIMLGVIEGYESLRINSLIFLS